MVKSLDGPVCEHGDNPLFASCRLCAVDTAEKGCSKCGADLDNAARCTLPNCPVVPDYEPT